MRAGVVQSIFWTLLLPFTIHVHLIFFLWAGAAGLPFDSSFPGEWIHEVSLTLFFMFPVTLGLLVVCPAFAILHLITAIRIAPQFPGPGRQFLVGILNPSLAICTVILAAFTHHLLS